MFLGYQQFDVLSEVRTYANLTVPSKHLGGVMLQAETGNVRYTMDDTTDPTNSTGMLLIAGNPPEQFLMDDLKRIRFIRSAGSATAKLNIHYFGGRDI